MEFILGIAFGYFISQALVYLQHVLFQRRLEKKVDEKIEELRSRFIPSKIEVVGESLMLYNSDTGEFIAQGKTFEELDDNAKAKYPDKFFNVPQSELNKLYSFNLDK